MHFQISGLHWTATESSAKQHHKTVENDLKMSNCVSLCYRVPLMMEIKQVS